MDCGGLDSELIRTLRLPRHLHPSPRSWGGTIWIAADVTLELSTLYALLGEGMSLDCGCPDLGNEAAVGPPLEEAVTPK